MISLALFLAVAQGGSLERVSIKVDGVDRTFLVHIPRTKDLRLRPVVFAFHGHGGTAVSTSRKFKFDQIWPEAVSVYMQGLPTVGQLTDPQGQRSGWQGNKGDYEDRDLKFFDETLKWVRSKALVNDKAIFSTGHSNGGGFTYLLYSTHQNLFAAIAPSAAGGRAANGETPVPLFHVSGSKDPLVKFAMQQRTVERMKVIDKVEPEGKPISPLMTRWESKTGVPVIHYVFDGGHVVPDDAVLEILKFFKSYAKGQ